MDLPKGKPIISFDFDGVIHSYTSGWKGAAVIPDPPVDGALEALARYTEHFQVAIFSGRSHQWGGRKAMKDWLYDQYLALAGVVSKRSFSGLIESVNLAPMTTTCTLQVPLWYHQFILQEFTKSIEPWHVLVADNVKQFLDKIQFPKIKPPAFMMIDDRCYHFQGSFPDPEKLLQFKPWYRKDDYYQSKPEEPLIVE